MGQLLRLECRDVIRMKLQKLKPNAGIGVNSSKTETSKDGYQLMEYIDLNENIESLGDGLTFPNEPDNYIGISGLDYQTFPLKSDTEKFEWTEISTKNLTGKENPRGKSCEEIVFEDLIGSVTSKTIDEEERKHLTSMILYTWTSLDPSKLNEIIEKILISLAKCCTRLQEHRTWSLTVLIIWLEKNGNLDIVTVEHLKKLKDEISGLDIKSSGLEDVIKSPYWEFYKLLDMVDNFIKDKEEKEEQKKKNNNEEKTKIDDKKVFDVRKVTKH